MSNPLVKAIVTLKERMREHADSAMVLQVNDAARFHEIVGAWRGMQEAVQILENILNEGDVN